VTDEDKGSFSKFHVSQQIRSLVPSC